MTSILPLLIKGLIAFIATNVDDLLLLVLFLRRHDGRAKTWKVLAGQYLGFLVILLISLLASLTRFVVQPEWIGVLGLVPLSNGVRMLIRKRVSRGEIHPAPNLFMMTILTIGDGADNVSTYTPLFALETLPHVGILVIFFLLLLLGWYALGSLIAHARFMVPIAKYLDRLLPWIFIVLGCLILYESGTASSFAQWIGSRIHLAFLSILMQ